jgi:flagellar operon protein (TIGR03826 family)
MQASNCPRCGRVFTKIKAHVCPACVKADEETFEKVREYVKENPFHSIQDVADETQVPVKRIAQFIRDGRLEVSAGMAPEITCAQCNKPIRGGRFCEKCTMELKNGLLAKPKTEFERKTGKMHSGR